MKPRLALVLLLAGPGAAAAQSGTVVDRITEAPVPGARVEWTTAERPATRVIAHTDVRGSFEGPRDGQEVLLSVSALGYEATSLSWEAVLEGGGRIALEPLALPLDEVVVTATGRPSRRSEVAVPIETVSARELHSANAPAVDRLLAELPAVQQAAQAPTGTNLMIRGIGGSRVLVLLDGQPAGGSLLENRDLSRLSLAGVERVEVVKGPLSSLYGSDALGGVINVVTGVPETGFRAHASALSGGAGRREAAATVESGSEDLQYRVTGSWRQEDRVPGLIDGSDAFARVWDVRSTARAQRGPWDFRADGSYLRERQRWPVGGGFSGFNDNTGVTAWSQARRQAGPGAVTLRVFGQSWDHLFRSARGTLPIETDGDETQKERLLEVSALYGAAMGRHELDLGMEAALRRIESPDKILSDEASDQQLELFAQDAWRMGRTIVTGGARATLNDRWGSSLSPTLGVTHGFGTAVRLRSSISRGFRAPSFKELTWSFANLGAGYTVLGNEDLRPERSWSLSAGAEWTPSASVSVEVEAYRTEVENLIESAFQGYTASGLLIYTPRNVAQAVTQGGEVSVRALGDGWDLAAGYGFLDARSLDLDLPLDRRARHTGRLRASWQLTSATRLDGTLHYTGAAPIIGFDENGRNGQIGTQERFAATDLQAATSLPGGLEATVGVDNLFDTRPGGWPATTQRQLRVGLAARNLFGR
ncbi:MAG: TonB-dependent receptor [Gemmatimonadota bacterium]|nr:TonB-dependent receptor [Gemmatimonadota bacterium]